MHIILILAIKTDPYMFPVQPNKCERKKSMSCFDCAEEARPGALYISSPGVYVFFQRATLENKKIARGTIPPQSWVSLRAKLLLKSSLKPVQTLKKMEEIK